MCEGSKASQKIYFFALPVDNQRQLHCLPSFQQPQTVNIFTNRQDDEVFRVSLRCTLSNLGQGPVKAIHITRETPTPVAAAVVGSSSSGKQQQQQQQH